MKSKTFLMLSAVSIGLLSTGLHAATITGWNTTNVAVGATPAEGVTG